MKPIFHLLCGALSLGIATLSATAAPGDLDPGFGTGGKVVTPIGGGDDRGYAMVMQSDGKLVVAGYYYNGSNNDFAVVRYYADGTLDTSFNGTGKATTDFGGSNDTANGVALQGDGKIVVVGGSLSGGSQVFALARYNADGTLDTGFGPAGTGKIKTTIGQISTNCQPTAVRVQADGRIVVAGYAFTSGNYDFTLVRYNSDGSLDNGFGAGGLVTTEIAGTHDYAYALALQSDGKIVVGGYSGVSSFSFAVTRYNSNGTLDTSFGGTGKVTVNGVGSYCYQVAVQSDGKIVLAGATGASGAQDFRLARLTASGTLDATFGTAGLVVTGVGTADDVPYGLVLQSDGKLVTAGYSYNANTNFNDFALVRYNSNGTLDTSLQSTGKVTTSFSGGSAIGRSVVIGSDGRIVVAGYAHNGTKNNFALVRYFGTDQPPIVTTGAATGIVRTGALLDGVVNPNSLATTAHFEYGPTTSYGSTTSDQALGNGHTATIVSSTIGALTDNTLYHYRLVATNVAGTSYGLDGTFTTAPNPPLAFTGDAASVNATGATLVGVVIPNGRITTAYFEFGLSTAYGAQTNSQIVPANGTVVDVFAPLLGLVSGATYHFRVVAVNAGSPIPIVGVDKTFVASDPPPTVTTGGAISLSTTSARVTGFVRARNTNAQVFFDYGTNGVTFPISVAASPAVVTGDTETAVSAVLTNLAQGVTYYYRARAVNSGGTGTGVVASLALDLLSGLIQQSPGLIAAGDRQGFLIVNLIPGGLLGTGWRFVGEQQWRASGVPATGLTTSDREIEFRPVAGYYQPLRETVSVLSGGAATVVTREYYEAAGSGGTGGMLILLKPESLTLPALPVAERAQWRLLGEDDTQWRESGAALDGLRPGGYLVESKPIAGRTTPSPLTVNVVEGQTTVAAATYYLADTQTGTPPSVVPFDTVTGSPTLPYQYVGQLRSNAGGGTGFVVKPRVVATAAHLVFDDGTLAAATGLQWLFERDKGTYEPKPQIPRGFYTFAGYAAQRQLENTPGESSPASQTLDAAALYFLEDAGRGGYSGYLASDTTPNEWLLSNAQKMLVGYPTAGIIAANQGRMHATPAMNVPFTHSYLRTYTTSAIRSSGGNSGGPLCVLFDNGSYYPAAIYLGGTGQTVVRVIDSEVIEMFRRAEVSANGGGNQGDGGITHTDSPLGGGTAAGASLKVNLNPSIIQGTARWKIGSGGTERTSGAQLNSLTAGTYALYFTSVSGFITPASPSNQTLTAGQLTTVTATYHGIKVQPQDQTVNALTDVTFSVDVSGTPIAYQWKLDGVNIPGATAASYTINAVTTAKEGNYKVRVTWDNGVITSDVAVLTVLPATQTITFGTLPNRVLGDGAFSLNASASSGLPVSYQLLSGPATLAGNIVTPTSLGTVSIRATQTGSGDYQAAPAVDRSFAVTGDNLDTWRARIFPPGELGNAQLSGPLADPDADGIRNLLEFALNLDPKSVDRTVMTPGTGTRGLPVVALENIGGTLRLTGEYVRRRAAGSPGITYSFEFTSDLTNPAAWSATGTESVTPIDAIWERVKATDTQPAGNNRAGRLKVTQP